MRVLLLSPQPERLMPVFDGAGDDVVIHTAPLDAATARASGAAFVVSHGYRHILRGEVLALLPGRIVNLHIALLPFNRGADPNLWSFLEDTPKGVTLHHVDDGVDTGDIVAQRTMTFPPGATLASTYEGLQRAVVELFAGTWETLRDGRAPRRPQSGRGSHHRSRDKEPYLHLLSAGWNTPVDSLVGRALVKAPS